MTTHLTPHLDSLRTTCAAIATLPFRRPSKFVNAILHSTDITTLIRDTEAHERALFTAVTDNNTTSYISGGAGGIGVKRNTAVGAYLGGEMEMRLRRGTIAGGQQGVDVELLLKGAERLLKVYPIPNAEKRISKLRQQYESLKDSIDHYTYQVDEQTRELEELLKNEGVALEDVKMEDAGTAVDEEEITMAMIEEEQRTLEELEVKKLGLEMDIKQYERHLTGA